MEKDLATYAILHRLTHVREIFELPCHISYSISSMARRLLVLFRQKTVEARHVVERLGKPDYFGFGHGDLRPAANLSSHAVAAALLTA